MNETSFLSPVVLSSSRMESCDFWVSQVPPPPDSDLRCDVSLESTHGDLAHSNNAFSIFARLHVGVTLVALDEDGGIGEEKMHVLLSLAGTISVPDTLGIEEGNLKKSLLTNSVSLLYASARSHVEYLSSASSMGRFTIPAIDPAAYLATLESTSKNAAVDAGRAAKETADKAKDAAK